MQLSKVVLLSKWKYTDDNHLIFHMIIPEKQQQYLIIVLFVLHH